MRPTHYMSGLVSLGETHTDFFVVLGLVAPLVMTVEQFRRLLGQAEGVVAVVISESEADPLFGWLSRRMLDDIVEEFCSVA